MPFRSPRLIFHVKGTMKTRFERFRCPKRMQAPAATFFSSFLRGVTSPTKCSLHLSITARHSAISPAFHWWTRNGPRRRYWMHANVPSDRSGKCQTNSCRKHLNGLTHIQREPKPWIHRKYATRAIQRCRNNQSEFNLIWPSVMLRFPCCHLGLCEPVHRLSVRKQRKILPSARDAALQP